MSGIPQNSSVVIPRLICRNPATAIEFCVNALGAEVLNRRPGPDGTVAHALLTIGPAMVMIEAEWPTLPSRTPAPDGSSPVVIFVYVENVDAVIDRAVALGARILVPLQDQFWGDRIAWIMDPSGHVWTVASRIEATTADERTARWAAILASDQAPATEPSTTTPLPASVQIRPVQSTDVEGWAALRLALWPDESAAGLREEAARFVATSPHGLGALLEAVFVAQDLTSGTILGFAEVSRRLYAEGCESSPVGFLEGWYIVADHRRQGIGGALVAAAEVWAANLGCTEFASDALADNTLSASAHKALGFTEVEVIRCFRKDLLKPDGTAVRPT